MRSFEICISGELFKAVQYASIKAILHNVWNNIKSIYILRSGKYTRWKKCYQDEKSVTINHYMALILNMLETDYASS